MTVTPTEKSRASRNRTATEVLRKRMWVLQQSLDGRVAALALSIAPRAVHKCRILARRMRVYLRAYASCFEPRAAKRYARALRELANDLNAVREADVTRAALRGFTMDSNAPRAARASTMMAFAAAARVRAAGELRAAMRGRDWRKRNAGLRRLAALPSLVVETEDSMAAVTQRLVKRQRRRLRRALRDAGKGQEELHKLRLKIKTMRYLLEEFGSRGSGANQSELKRLRQLQECLGELHDAWLLNRRLRAELRPLPAARGVRAQLRVLRRALRREFRKRRDGLLRLWDDGG